MTDKTCYTCNLIKTCDKTPASKTCSNWIGDMDILKCGCGSTDFEIELNCKLEDVVDDLALHSIRCSNCKDEAYLFEQT